METLASSFSHTTTQVVPATAASPSDAMQSAVSPSSNVPVAPSNFTERRRLGTDGGAMAERRQFASTHTDLSNEARDLALAIDGYKARHRRRYITFEEMLTVIKSLGYNRS
jgi:hypothetical protein